MRYFLIILLSACGSSRNTTNTSRPPVIVQPPVIVVPIDTLVIVPEFKLNWTDRRPIGMVMLSTAPNTESQVVLGNRNWKLGGQMQFSKEALNDHIQESIRNLKYLNAQGVIIWDIEGSEYFHPITYMGQPQLLSKLAPEMDSLADDLFRSLRASGFKVGVTIRPDFIKYYDDKKIYWHHAAENPLINLAEKIKYAYDRWGCTLFYVDTNTDQYGATLPGTIFSDLAKLFPDCLLIPEWEGEQTAYWRSTAPFKWLYQYRPDVSPTVKQRVPDAFMVLSVGDVTADLKQSVQEGNILMGRVWYKSSEIELIKRAYEGQR